MTRRFYPYKEADSLSLLKLQQAGHDDPCKTYCMQFSHEIYEMLETHFPSYRLTADTTDLEHSYVMIWLSFDDEEEEVQFKLTYTEVINNVDVRYG